VGSVEGSAVAEQPPAATLPGYERQGGPVPVLYRAGMERRAYVLHDLLSSGAAAISAILEVGPPELEALLAADDDWERAPREEAYRPYPAGLPYFTRAASPPALVLPETLSGAFWPRTKATYPLVVWHELAHSFLLREPLVRTPAWLRELLPQGLSVAVARRTGVPLDEHLRRIARRAPDFTVRSYPERASAGKQMAFQNLLLSVGAAAVERFGEEFLRNLAHSLREEEDVVGEERAQQLLAASLGAGGREWLSLRPEF
jgi:hypothetical protein